MIPIGTRCLIVGARIQPKLNGVVVTVAEYSLRGFRCSITRKLYRYRLAEPHPTTGRRIIAHEWQLIPIGHDPDTETRTTDREVTA